MNTDKDQVPQCDKTAVMRWVLFDDDLVTYETALLAREKGFDIDCGWKLRKLDDGTFTHTNCSDLGVEQPTQSLLQKWLREEFPELKSRLPCMWTRSYHAGTVGHVSEETVKKYIENQKNV